MRHEIEAVRLEITFTTCGNSGSFVTNEDCELGGLVVDSVSNHSSHDSGIISNIGSIADDVKALE